MKRFLDAVERFARVKPKPRHEGPHYADMLTRVVAAALDLWVLYLLLFDLFEYLSRRIYQGVDVAHFQAAQQQAQLLDRLSGMWQAGALPLWIVNCVIQYAIIGVVLVGSQIVLQTTPGKWVLGLKIVQRGSLAPIAPWRYVLRYVAYFASAAPLMLGFAWAHFNREHRTWHDMIAGTVVLQTRPAGWYWGKVKSAWRRWRNRPSGETTDGPANPRSGPSESP